MVSLQALSCENSHRGYLPPHRVFSTFGVAGGCSSSSSNGGISRVAFDCVNHIYCSELLGKGRMGIWVYGIFWLRNCSLFVKWFLFGAI